MVLTQVRAFSLYPSVSCMSDMCINEDDASSCDNTGGACLSSGRGVSEMAASDRQGSSLFNAPGPADALYTGAHLPAAPSPPDQVSLPLSPIFEGSGPIPVN